MLLYYSVNQCEQAAIKFSVSFILITLDELGDTLENSILREVPLLFHSQFVSLYLHLKAAKFVVGYVKLSLG